MRTCGSCVGNILYQKDSTVLAQCEWMRKGDEVELNTRDTLYRQEVQSLKAEISALHLQAHARTSQASSPLIKKEFGEEKGEEISESPARSMRSPKKENEDLGDGHRRSRKSNLRGY